jgi:site-specific recombinase XerD
MKPTGKAFFVSEQRKPLHRSTVNLLLRKYSAAASMPLLAHPHMLRHACGFALADQGADTRLIQNYLGHRNIQHTIKYTATNSARFESCGGEPKRRPTAHFMAAARIAVLRLSEIAQLLFCLELSNQSRSE